MKRKAHIHAKHGGQGAGQVKYTRLTKSQKNRIRPMASTDPGASIVDDPVKITLYTAGVLALCYGLHLIQKLLL